MSFPLHPVIALDGTAASGKSTFARALARRLAFVYVNTGAMYRGVTWYLLEKEIPVQDEAVVAQAMKEMKLETRFRPGEFTFLIDGIDPQRHLREGRVNQAVSAVSQVAEVRHLLVAEQRLLADLSPLVMEGRDIGTVVFPETPYKLFLDADVEVRAARRSHQGETDMIRQRDILDSQRRNSPLTLAPDALSLDSGQDSVDTLVEKALVHLAAKGLEIPVAS